MDKGGMLSKRQDKKRAGAKVGWRSRCRRLFPLFLRLFLPAGTKICWQIKTMRFRPKTPHKEHRDVPIDDAHVKGNITARLRYGT